MAIEHTQLLGGGSGSSNTWKIPVKAEICAGGLSGREGELSDDRGLLFTGRVDSAEGASSSVF